MKLLPEPYRTALRAAAEAHLAAQAAGAPEPDPVPIVKFLSRWRGDMARDRTG